MTVATTSQTRTWSEELFGFIVFPQFYPYLRLTASTMSVVSASFTSGCVLTGGANVQSNPSFLIEKHSTDTALCSLVLNILNRNLLIFRYEQL